MMWQRRESIGLDFGVKELKLVQLETEGSGALTLQWADSIPLPSEERERVSLLKNVVVQNRLEGMSAAVTFQDETLHIRPLELPKMPKEDLIEAIRWQLRDIAEETMEDYLVQYSLMEEKVLPDIVRLNLLGFAVKKTTIEAKTALLLKAGLKPFFVEPTPVAMSATVERVYRTEEKNWAACADLGYKNPYFLVVGMGRLRFIRPLSGMMGLDITSEEYPSKLSVELQNALDAFFIGHPNEKIEKIFLAGGGVLHPNLPPLLTKNLGTSMEILNPFQGIGQARPFPAVVEKQHLFGPACGSALLKP